MVYKWLESWLLFPSPFLLLFFTSSLLCDLLSISLVLPHHLRIKGERRRCNVTKEFEQCDKTLSFGYLLMFAPLLSRSRFCVKICEKYWGWGCVLWVLLFDCEEKAARRDLHYSIATRKYASTSQWKEYGKVMYTVVEENITLE